MIAAILESGELERLSTGLSLLVSAAAEGTPARGLATFGPQRAGAVEAIGLDRAAVEARLDGVMSTPRFLREVAGAQLVVV